MSWFAGAVTVYNIISERQTMQNMIDRIAGPTERSISNIED